MDIYYRHDIKKLCDSLGNEITNTSNYPLLPCQSTITIDWYFLYFNPTTELIEAKDVSAIAAWEYSVDKDFLSSTIVMAEATDSNINDSDAVNGHLVITLNTNTSQFLEAVDGKDTVAVKGQLKALNSSAVKIDAYKHGVIADGDLNLSVDPPTEAVTNHYTKAESDALLSEKEPTLTKGNLTELTSSVLTITGGTAAIIGSGLTITVKSASTTQSGYLSSKDWNTFNNKQEALTFGIADTNKVQINSASVTAGEYAKFTASGLESRSMAEVLSDICAQASGNYEVSTNKETSALDTSPTKYPCNNVVKSANDLKIDKDYSGYTAEASPASGMKLLINNAGIVKTVDWSALPGAGSGLPEASIAETNTGTATNKAVTPDSLAGSIYGQRIIQIQLNDSTALTTTAKGYFRIPAVMNGWKLVSVAAMCVGASSNGAVTLTVKNGATSMLSTNITIDQSETDTSTAATAAVIDTAEDDVATGNQIEVACSGAGTGVTYCVVELTFQLP